MTDKKDDNLKLYEMLESLPAIVVGEDTTWGDRHSDVVINSEIDPMEALADKSMYKPLDSWMFGMNEMLKYRVDSAIAAGAQGEVFLQYLHDDAFAWQYPDQRNELERHNIPVLLFEAQNYRLSNLERLKEQAKSFIQDSQFNK